MKKILLKNLPSDIEHLIDDRARAEELSREQAVVEFLRDAWIERAIEHDIALLQREERFDHEWVESFAGVPDDFVRPPQ